MVQVWDVPQEPWGKQKQQWYKDDKKNNPQTGDDSKWQVCFPVSSKVNVTICIQHPSSLHMHIMNNLERDYCHICVTENQQCTEGMGNIPVYVTTRAMSCNFGQNHKQKKNI